MCSHFLEFLLVGVLLAGCEREERSVRVDPEAATPATAVQLSTLVPGLPSTQPAAAPGAVIVQNNYEKQAYQLSEGQQLYSFYNCNTCHADGGGDIGPALIDDKWIYGADPEQVYASIVQGRPNGMPAYGSRLTEHQAWQLAAYVRSMSGQVSQFAAPGRSDHMKTKPPENTIDPVKPKDTSLPKPGEASQ